MNPRTTHSRPPPSHQRALWAGRLLCGLLGGLWGHTGHAALPAAYRALVVEPQQVNGQWEFDLRPAFAHARHTGKSLYLYLGAQDCPYCRRYEAFLQANAAVLVPRFASRYVVVDLRSLLSITERQMVWRTDALRLPYPEFQRAIGDQRARLLVYPSVWLLNPQTGKPLMQMPAGTGTFQTVDEQNEILDLVE